jgi:polysaccharide export outer membrane protein
MPSIRFFERLAAALSATCLTAGIALTAAPVTSLAQAQAAIQAAPDYAIGAGDIVRIGVFQNPELSLETRVSESGSIGYPLLGQLRLGGLTAAQAESAIADGLRRGQFIRDPQVTVVVSQVRGNQVSVLGLVNRPGRYPIETNGMRLSDMLAQAGGVAAGGSDSAVLSGIRGGKRFRVEIDVPALFARQEGDDPTVQSGDVIFVDRMPTIYIYGEVQRPGAMRLEREMNVMQALAAGGGLTARGTQRGLRVHRRGDQGAAIVVEPKMDDRLQDGDVIHVRESLF